MSASTLTLTYQRPQSSRTPRDLLQIEQDDWRPYTGVVTVGEMVGYLANWLYSEQYDSMIDCGLVGDDVVCTVRVYPREPNLAYQFYTSWGTLSARSVAMLEIEETINFAMEARVSPEHPPRSIASAEWLDDCYDLEGNIISPPALAIDGEEIVSSVACYGSVLVSYVTEQHTYLVTCPRRAEAIDNNFSAVVYGVYSGGLNWLVLEMPPGIDAFEADQEARCGWGGISGSITGPEDGVPEDTTKADKLTVVDYCSQQVADERIIPG